MALNPQTPEAVLKMSQGINTTIVASMAGKRNFQLWWNFRRLSKLAISGTDIDKILIQK